MKEQIFQDIFLHEVVTKPKPMLDQLAEGLKTLNVLTHIRAFPDQFKPLFVSEEKVTSNDVKKILIKPNFNNSSEERLWHSLINFLDYCSTEGR